MTDGGGVPPRLSPALLRLLGIVVDAPYGITAARAATRLWPRSPSWGSPTFRDAGGVVFGQGAQMRAGVLMERLRVAGMVRRSWPPRLWVATPAGRDYMASLRLLSFDDGDGPPPSEP